jgi:translation initiation factor IF-2
MNSGKVRIYELSRELNLDNKDLLAICEQQNISVKSHSSTITDSEAERIRAAAEKYTAGNSSHKPAPVRHSGNAHTEGRAKVPAPIQKKQQILEIRKPTIRSVVSPEPPKPATPPPAPVAPVTAPEQSSQPAIASSLTPAPAKPAAVTNRPVRPAESPDLAELPMQQPEVPVDGTTLDEAVVVTQLEENLSLELPIEEDRSTPAKPAPVLMEPQIQPELAGPPVRPASPAVPVKSNLANRPVLKRSQATEPAATASKGPSERPAPVRDRSESRPTAPAGGQRPTPSGNRQQSPAAKSSEDRPTQRPQTIVELRRPRPVRPDTAESANRGDGRSGDIQALVEPVLKERPKPLVSAPAGAAATEDALIARPSLPSRAKKGKDWQDDDEEEKAAAKAPSKGKRRLQPDPEDEDEDLEAFLEDEEDAEAPVQVNLSLVRPAKPKASRPPQAKAPIAAAPKAKKPAAAMRDRREKREEDKPEKPEKITLTGGLTVQELAALLVIPETDIIRSLFFKGIAANITQTLDIPTATMVAKEFGIEVETGEKEAEARKVTEMVDETDLENLQRRPPVVTIMGHVDHGKTTLLDSIRKTKVAQGEAGGITQHIGAYHVDVEHNGEMQQVVFLDTPGHEAFTAMRARGARVTDIAILVVAADDGVRPQTIEAISHAKAAEVPIIVAINKVDKEEAQPDRVKQELTEYGLVPEEWGGDAIMVPVSAIKGDNLDTLLEMILLVAEVEELYANPDRSARGTVIEAHLDKAKGPVATLIIQNGTLHVGDTLVAGSVLGKVRAMMDDRGDRVKTASPSFAVEVLGLNDVPAAGDEFEVFQDEKEARAVSATRANEQRQTRLMQAMSSRRVSLNTLSARAQEGDLKELNLVLKADVQGSVEAILGSLKQLPQNEVQVRVLYAAPGEISETDVDLAAASDAVIIGFNTTLAPGARQTADQKGVDVRDYNIIYKLLDDIQAAMEGLLEPELVEESLGQVEVRAVFPVGRGGAVAGCYVQSGKAVRNAKIRVLRGGEVLYDGNLDSLKRMKEDAREVNAGFECGIGVDKFNNWQVGDIIEVYRMVAKRRTLSPAR